MKARLTESVQVDFWGIAMDVRASGSLYLKKHDILVFSDLHFGKSHSFARLGKMIPPFEIDSCLDRMEVDLNETMPARVICLGDSFHDGDSLDALGGRHLQRLNYFRGGRDWFWITGNHDQSVLTRPCPFLDSKQVVPHLDVGDIRFEHLPPKGAVGEGPSFRVFGHWHPKARVKLTAHRAVSGRCFVLGDRRLCMPAYGTFAGGLEWSHPGLAGSVGTVRSLLLCRPPRIYQFPIE